MTPQELFETVVRGVRRKGLPAGKKKLVKPLRKRAADRLRLDRLAGPWRTRVQMDSIPEMEGTFSFAVVGDAEPGRFWVFRRLFNIPGVFERQLSDLRGRGVDFVLQLGDMVSRGVPGNFLRFFRSLAASGLRVPYLTVIGNHDRRFPHGVTDSVLYRRCFGPTNYHFDRGGARFVVLDTSTARVRRRQLAWLAKALDTPLRKFVFMHIPPASLREWTDFGGAKGVGGFHDGAEELTVLFSEAGVDRVYMGHIHGFGVQDFKGVRYVLTGGGGSPLFPSGVGDKFHHYIVVTVGPGGVSEKVHDLDGRVLSIPNSRVILAK